MFETQFPVYSMFFALKSALIALYTYLKTFNMVLRNNFALFPLHNDDIILNNIVFNWIYQSITVILGWSRYDHFAVQCELLPVAVPSLVLRQKPF